MQYFELETVANTFPQSVLDIRLFLDSATAPAGIVKLVNHLPVRSTQIVWRMLAASFQARPLTIGAAKFVMLATRTALDNTYAVLIHMKFFQFRFRIFAHSQTLQFFTVCGTCGTSASVGHQSGTYG